MKKWWNSIRHFGSMLFGMRKEEGPEGLPFPPPRTSLVELTEREPLIGEAVRWYGRRKVRKEIREVHHRLITERPDSSLSRRIRKLFPAPH